jgi:hypothetical protein
MRFTDLLLSTFYARLPFTSTATLVNRSTHEIAPFPAVPYSIQKLKQSEEKLFEKVTLYKL